MLEGLATHPDILAAEQQRVRLLLVDDAQHLDPQMAELVETIRKGAHLTVVAGDPDQNVFRFRGADP
ncbi:UvrD-helicase domain-containing protein, partial [Streptomyces sp. AS02]